MRVTERDHIDRFLERLASLGHPDIDLEVEAIVDRIGGINRRIKRGMEVTLAAARPDPPRLAGADDAPTLALRPSQLAR